MNLFRRRWLTTGTILLISSALGIPARSDQVPVIAAAADLKFALTEIAAEFQKASGKQVKLAFGSTGNFATQIRQGAPFQMFLAADEKFVADLHNEGLTRDEGTLYAEGRIVIIVPPGSALTPDPNLDGLAGLLEQGKITHFAIANPDHAPYGKRAEEALKHRGLWEKLQTKLVMGENVAQAAQFALSGNAEGGIVAYSLALAPELKGKSEFALIPHDWHEPLLQRMVLLKNADPVAEEFYAYMRSPAARDIMKAYGFILPDGE